MERAAEIAALVLAARDAMLRWGPAELRVAFILFDSAAETLMVRAIHSELGWGRFSRDRMTSARPEALRQVDLKDPLQREREDPHANDPIDLNDLGSWINQIDWYLTATQQQSIDRNFDDKLRFLAWDGRLPTELVGVVSRLHEYRNEMYHREESRPNALQISVHLYALVLTQLLELLPPQWLSSGGEAELERILGRLSIPDSRPSTRWDFGGVQRLLAEELRASVDVSDAHEVIGDYIRERVAQVDESMRFIGDYIVEFDHSVPAATVLDVVKFLYNRDPFVTLLEMRNRSAPVTSKMLARWEGWPDNMSPDLAPLEVFASLAAFEREFETFERVVREASSEVDTAIQNEIDRRRGK